LRGLKEISKFMSFYLLTNYAKNRTILSHDLCGCVLLTWTKINLSVSLVKRKKKTNHSGVTNFDTDVMNEILERNFTNPIR